jgi:HEAT repeat protein
MVKRKRQSKDVPSLLADLGSSATFVRRSAIIELVEKSPPEAIGPLELLLLDKEAAIRACAAWALGEIGAERSVKPLVVCLKDMDVDVRRAAVQSLSRMALPENQAVLESASVDSDRWVAEWARRGLARLLKAPVRRRRPRPAVSVT